MEPILEDEEKKYPTTPVRRSRVPDTEYPTPGSASSVKSPERAHRDYLHSLLTPDGCSKLLVSTTLDELLNAPYLRIYKGNVTFCARYLYPAYDKAAEQEGEQFWHRVLTKIKHPAIQDYICFRFVEKKPIPKDVVETLKKRDDISVELTRHLAAFD